ncbi:PIG-L family deacetylase [Micrococcus endophyticus]|uniref:PIG-L family deacetylase n=1 Tax=Micrococcus endophyticus TaxID=455343 RepID=UPI00382E9E41
MSFSHTDAGTSEEAWAAAGVGALPALEAPAWDADTLLLVAVAHPDDETLGATGLIRSALRGGARVHVLVATAGEASHPDSPTHAPEDLVRLRRTEMEHALDALAADLPGPGEDRRSALTWESLGLPDSGVAGREDAVRAAVVAALAAHPGPAVLASHDPGDGHADHEAVGRAVGELAGERDLPLCAFPIWFWHWADPAELPARRYRRLALTDDDRAARRAALDAHASQVRPLSDAPGDEAVLGPQVLAHHDRPFEAHRLSGPDDADAHRAAAVFDRLYREHEDPWRYLSSPYEARKRALTLAVLPRPRYGTVVEAGASIGVLTGEVAARADRVVGLEASPTAVERAAARLADTPHAEVRRAVLPGHWPDDVAGADLVIASEIGYFLQPEELDALIDDADAALAPGGELLLCHWRHPIEGWPLDGDAVHARVAADPRWRVRTELVEEDFRISLHVRAAAATHAVVIVPAKDEQERLPAALAALGAALDRWEEHHAQGSAAVVVAADRCDDATVAAAEAARHADSRVHVLELGEPGPGEAGVGRARAEAARRARALFPDVPAQRLWLASTDADSRVPADWLLAQTTAAGPDGALVLGTVDVREGALRRAWVRDYRHEEGHPHVHGANLGLPWSLYEAAGGFPPVAEHEDVRLVEAVRALAEARVRATDTTRVLTSSRLTGRTPGGFAGHLQEVGGEAVPRRGAQARP